MSRPQAHELGLTRVTVTFTAEGTLPGRRPRRSRVAAREARDPGRALAVDRRAARRAAGAHHGVAGRRARARAVPVRRRVAPRPHLRRTCPDRRSRRARRACRRRRRPTATLRFSGAVPSGARTLPDQLRAGARVVRADTRPAPRSGQPVRPCGWRAARTAEPFNLRDGLVARVPARHRTRVRRARLRRTSCRRASITSCSSLGLFLLSTSWRPLLLQVTMFTRRALAHARLVDVRDRLAAIARSSSR